MNLKLSIQRALLGEVTNRLVSVTCGLKDSQVEVMMYVQGEVNDDDLEHLGFVAAEVIADFPEGYTIVESCVSLTREKEEMLDFWAYRRSDP